MTEEQERDYVAGGGASCPYCGSSNISTTGSIENLGGACGTQPVECETCGKTWNDVLTLTGVLKEE